mmetsp:Transcript_37709/g.83999  ORF Transcript_37709/g.83999 Transcript_37709/m.83999 type:complete len:212 (-) Transcript_37709:1706-2341(-)
MLDGCRLKKGRHTYTHAYMLRCTAYTTYLHPHPRTRNTRALVVKAYLSNKLLPTISSPTTQPTISPATTKPQHCSPCTMPSSSPLACLLMLSHNYTTFCSISHPLPSASALQQCCLTHSLLLCAQPLQPRQLRAASHLHLAVLEPCSTSADRWGQCSRSMSSVPRCQQPCMHRSLPAAHPPELRSKTQCCGAVLLPGSSPAPAAAPHQTVA